LGFSPASSALELTLTLIAFVSLGCAVHHKKTHLHGIGVVAIRYMNRR
jgi:hypothetical protein